MSDDDEVVLEYSKHNGAFTRDGITVTVAIYRGKDDQGGWILEVEDATGGSTIWEEPFETDDAAWEEFLASVGKDGIAQFVFDDEEDEPTKH